MKKTYEVFVNIEIAGFVTAENEAEADDKAGEFITAKIDKRVIKKADSNYLSIDCFEREE